MGNHRDYGEETDSARAWPASDAERKRVRRRAWMRHREEMAAEAKAAVPEYTRGPRAPRAGRLNDGEQIRADLHHALNLARQDSAYWWDVDRVERCRRFIDNAVHRLVPDPAHWTEHEKDVQERWREIDRLGEALKAAGEELTRRGEVQEQHARQIKELRESLENRLAVAHSKIRSLEKDAAEFRRDHYFPGESDEAHVQVISRAVVDLSARVDVQETAVGELKRGRVPWSEFNSSRVELQGEIARLRESVTDLIDAGEDRAKEEELAAAPAKAALKPRHVDSTEQACLREAMAMGKTDEEIARQFGRSERTVRSWRRRFEDAGHLIKRTRRRGCK